MFKCIKDLDFNPDYRNLLQPAECIFCIWKGSSERWEKVGSYEEWVYIQNEDNTIKIRLEVEKFKEHFKDIKEK